MPNPLPQLVAALDTPDEARALRLAALEIQIAQGFNMPLIADDLFVNFDDRRTEAGLKVLGDLSRRMQVIFLTHHEHLVPLAREVLGDGLNLVVL